MSVSKIRWQRARTGEQPVVPAPEFSSSSYYGKPIVNQPRWKSPDIPGYLFLGGMAGASSVLAVGAQLTGRTRLSRRLKVGALVGVSLGTVGLIHDLGRPSRFLNMLRVFKPTSPMSVGSWLLATYGPLAGASALSELTGVWPGVGTAATLGAALTGPALASYTAALLADTAIPAWHEAFRELPFVSVGSAAAAAAGLGLVVAPVEENGPARRLAVAGAAVELLAAQHMEHRGGVTAEPYRRGTGGRYLRAGEVLTLAGLVGSVTISRRNRLAAALSGAALLGASACTRWGIFHAGLESARDPRYTVEPQRERLAGRESPRSA